ncbi:MAG: gamma-glutamyl-gamma-aminobutyrate hydrolase family protein [candidate division WOR-3 bacterium]
MVIIAKTLLLNFYLDHQKEKIIPYIDLIKDFSDYQVLGEKELSLKNIKNFDAIILSGSPKMISQNEFNQSILEILREIEIPILGICYGHQLLAKAFGGEIGKYLEFIERNEEIFLLNKEDIFYNLEDKIVAKKSHQEYVIKSSLTKTELEITAFSKNCEVEAIRHRKRKIFGVQFHIERSGEVGYRIIKNFYEKIVKY